MTTENTEVKVETPKVERLTHGVDPFEVFTKIPLDETNGHDTFASDFTKPNDNGEKKDENINLQGKEQGKDDKEGEKEVTETQPKTDLSKEGEEVIKPPPPSSKAKFEDKDIEVPEDAVFTFKAAKGEVSVPLKELKLSYQSRAERDRLFGQFQKERMAWDSDKKLVDEQFSNLAKDSTKNPWEVMNKLCSLYKVNPAEVLPVYLAQAKKTLDDLGKLPEDQQRIMFAKMGLEWESKQLDSKKAEEAMRQNTKQDEEYLDSLKAKFTISDEELDEAWGVVSQVENLNLDKKSKRETIDIVTSYITQFHRPFVKIESALSKVDKTLVNDVELKKTLKTLITDADTEEDVIEVVRIYLGKEDEPTTDESSGSKKVDAKPPSESEDKVETKPKSSNAPKAEKKRKRDEEDDEDEVILDLDQISERYNRR